MNRDLRRVVDSIISVPLLNSAVTQVLPFWKKVSFTPNPFYSPVKSPKVSRARQQTERQVCVCLCAVLGEGPSCLGTTVSELYFSKTEGIKDDKGPESIPKLPLETGGADG